MERQTIAAGGSRWGRKGQGQIPKEGRRLSEKSHKFPQKLVVALKVQFYHKNMLKNCEISISAMIKPLMLK